MYHISKDKRALQSSELIYNGLLECIRKKPFDQITVSDLQKASGVARSTFYRAFDIFQMCCIGSATPVFMRY